MAQKASTVIYIDRASVEHESLVTGVNPLNPEVLDVTYFDSKTDALKTEFGVPHMTDESKKEINPDLPQYSLNCWKERGAEHLALPSDHPANDHPFELKKQDSSGRLVTKARPEYEKHLAEVFTAEDAKDAEEKLPVGIGYSDVPRSGGIPVGETENYTSGHPSPEMAAEAQHEPDVTAQLDAAGPAPVVEEKKPEDPA